MALTYLQSEMCHELLTIIYSWMFHFSVVCEDRI